MTIQTTAYAKSLYAKSPLETDAAYAARMQRVIDAFNARQMEGKWSEGRERNRAFCIAQRDAALNRLLTE